MNDLPPQPHGDTKDITYYLENDEALGWCTRCQAWKSGVGQLNVNSPLVCRDCRIEAFRNTKAAPGNPLNM